MIRQVSRTCIAAAVPLALIAVPMGSVVAAPSVTPTLGIPAVNMLSALSYEFTGSSAVADATGHSREQVIMHGHALAAGDRVRIDIDDAGSASDLMRGAYILLSDAGRHLTWVNASYRQYYETDPESMFGGMDMLTSGANGFVTMSASNVHIDAQRVGAGPTIQGHSTVHYRLRQQMDMKTRVLSKSSVTHDESVIDYYYATDMPAVINPFIPAVPSLPGDGGMLGAEYTRQMHVAIDRLTQAAGGAALRIVTTTRTVDDCGNVRSSTVTTELSNIKQVTIGSNVFDVPLGYSKVAPPESMNGPAGMMQVGSVGGAGPFDALQSVGSMMAALDPIVLSRAGYIMQ